VHTVLNACRISLEFTYCTRSFSAFMIFIYSTVRTVENYIITEHLHLRTVCVYSI
jgi:hypothetical protein